MVDIGKALDIGDATTGAGAILMQPVIDKVVAQLVDENCEASWRHDVSISTKIGEHLEAWLAGIFDSDGSISFYQQKQNGSVYVNFSPVSNKRWDITNEVAKQVKLITKSKASLSVRENGLAELKIGSFGRQKAYLERISPYVQIRRTLTLVTLEFLERVRQRGFTGEARKEFLRHHLGTLSTRHKQDNTENRLSGCALAAWLAGVIDGDGCIRIETGYGKPTRPKITLNSIDFPHTTYVTALDELGIKSKDYVGFVKVLEKESVGKLLVATLPYLIGKLSQARLALVFLRLRRKLTWKLRFEALRLMKKLNSRQFVESSRSGAPLVERFIQRMKVCSDLHSDMQTQPEMVGRQALSLVMK